MIPFNKGFSLVLCIIRREDEEEEEDDDDDDDERNSTKLRLFDFIPLRM